LFNILNLKKHALCRYQTWRLITKLQTSKVSQVLGILLIVVINSYIMILSERRQFNWRYAEMYKYSRYLVHVTIF